jgi:hypothetical protein
MDISCIGVKAKYGVGKEGGRGVEGGSKYQTEIPKVSLIKFNVAMTRVLTILGGGNKKDT